MTDINMIEPKKNFGEVEVLKSIDLIMNLIEFKGIYRALPYTKTVRLNLGMLKSQEFEDTTDIDTFISRVAIEQSS